MCKLKLVTLALALAALCGSHADARGVRGTTRTSVAGGSRSYSGSSSASVSRSASGSSSASVNRSYSGSSSASVNRSYSGSSSATVNRNVNRNVNRDIDVDVDHGYYRGGRGYGYGGYHPVARVAGVAAATAVTAVAIGTIVNTLPPSCSTTVMGDVTYQECGGTWYQTRYEGTEVNYVVVDPPQ